LTPAKLTELKSIATIFGRYFKVAGVKDGALALCAGVLAAKRADPFAFLGKAADLRERLSREQAGIAVCIYRMLLKRIPREKALAAMAPLIEAGAIGFLIKTLPEVRPATLTKGTADTRRTLVRGWIDRFYTATAEIAEVTESQVVFHVTGCALVRLVHAAGHPELAPLFCKGDLAFFQQRGIRLTRPTTIAKGDALCRFELQRD